MTDKIALFPLSHGVFPDGMLSLQIFEVRYLDLIKRCHTQQIPFGVVWLKKAARFRCLVKHLCCTILAALHISATLKKCNPTYTG